MDEKLKLSTVGLDLDGQVEQYLAAATASNTQRTYQSARRTFERFWERLERLGDVWSQATPLDVMRWMAWAAAPEGGDLAAVTVKARLSGLAWWFERSGRVGVSNPAKAPEVRRMLQGICRSKGLRPKPKAALPPGQVRRICRRIPEGIMGARDRALLLLFCATGIRGAEMARLEVDDVVFGRGDEYIDILVQYGKADQNRRGRTQRVYRGRRRGSCPVAALRDWLGVSGVDAGPVWRQIAPNGAIGKPLRVTSMRDVAKRAAERIGLDPMTIGLHSFRSGKVTWLLEHGRNEAQVASSVGHRSVATTRRYHQPGLENVERDTGL